MSYKSKQNDYTRVEKPIEPNGWELRDEQKNKLYLEAMGRFASSTMFEQARVEGWAEQAFRYAKEMASYQASKIAGCENVGVLWGVVTGWDLPDRATQKARYHQFVESCNRAINQQFIQISIPSSAVNWWKNN